MYPVYSLKGRPRVSPLHILNANTCIIKDYFLFVHGEFPEDYNWKGRAVFRVMFHSFRLPRVTGEFGSPEPKASSLCGMGSWAWHEPGVHCRKKLLLPVRAGGVSPRLGVRSVVSTNQREVRLRCLRALAVVWSFLG